MTAPVADPAPPTDTDIRRLRADEAPGVTELVTLVYGDTYYPRELYDPRQIVSLNEAGRLVSIVAVNTAGNVVGHYALERPHQAAYAEASDAIVRPENRHHHLMEQMRLLLREEAVREGLTGLVGYAVTNHTFSQKAEEHFGAHPCGVALGLWPRSFHNMPEPLTQRMSFAIYFKFLRRPGPIVHVATHHHEIISRIYQQFDATIELRDDARAVGAGEVTVEYEAVVETGSIRVNRIGDDTPAAILQACQELCERSNVKALTLEVPLSQPGVGAVCRAAEERGFFYSGVGPAFADGSDALLLQMPREEIDPSLLQIAHPFAKELLDYAHRESERVRNGSELRS